MWAMTGLYPEIEPYEQGMLEDESLLRGASALADIPGILVNGRFDFQAPIANAWELNRAWPRAELVIVEDAGHAANEPALAQELVAATDKFDVRR